MEQSETIGKLAEARSKVQGSLRGYTEKSSNPHFKSKYGSLTDVWAAIREALSVNGLAVFQTMADGDAESVTVVTTLAHSSGEWIRGRLRLPYGRGSGPQAAGSAITYARRYALAAIVGVAPEDDDAEAAEGRGRGRDGGSRGETGRESDGGGASDVSDVEKLFKQKALEVERRIGKPMSQDVYRAVKAWNGGKNFKDSATTEAWSILCGLIHDHSATMATVKDILRISRPGDAGDVLHNASDWASQPDPDGPPPITEDQIPF